MLEADVEVDRRDFAVRASLRVAPGERLALFGPSGAGKTTLLEVIAGLVVPRRARITLGGRVLTATPGGSGGSSPEASTGRGGSGGSSPEASTGRGGSGGSSPEASSSEPATALPPWQRKVGLLRQDPGLFPHLSVRDNLRYARSGSERELAEVAAALGIDGLLAAMPARLSGGQAHRVALGRLLLSHCDALLLDEPYTGLDVSLRRTLTDLVVTLVADRAVPAILVAHELAEAQAFADRLAVLDRGAVLQCGAPAQVVLRPACRRVAELVGYAAFVPVPAQAGLWSCQARGPTIAAQLDAVAGVHPDRVVAGRHPDMGLVLAGVVTACRPAGARWEITVRTAGVAVTGRLAEPAPVGEQLVLTATAPPCFGPDGTAIETGVGPWSPGAPLATCQGRGAPPASGQAQVRT